MPLEVKTYDPATLDRHVPGILAELEQLRDSTKRARQQLAHVKSSDQHLACVLQAKGALIMECLNLEIPPEMLADTILKRTPDVSINHRKLVNAIRRIGQIMSVAEDGTPRKRIGRPPKNQDAADVAASTAQTVIATAKSTSAIAKPEKAPAASPKDSPEREQRMRRKAPVWAGNYSDHPQYGALVARRADESDADYGWRMWHTPPPWSHEQPRFADQLTETQWIEKCWNLKSPEERAAHEASLPTTAR